MWNEKEFWKNFCIDHAELARNIALALLGAVGRLANDHEKYDGLTLQFFYDLFRGFTLAIVAVILVDAVVSYFRVVGALGAASAIAAGFYAVEIIALIKESLPKVVGKIIAKIK